MTKKETLAIFEKASQLVDERLAKVAKSINSHTLYGIRVTCEHAIGTRATNVQVIKIAKILGII